MKKRIGFLLALALMFNICLGQNSSSSSSSLVKLGVKAGANYSNIYDSNGDTFTAEGKFGFAGGVFLGIPLGKFLGVQPEVLYSQKGYKQTGSFLGNNYTLTRTTDFIDVPLLISIKPLNVLTLQIGPQYSFLIKQNDSFSNSITTIEQQKLFKNENIRKNTLCLTGGLDINISRLIIGVRTGWDVQNNNGDGTSTNPRYKNAWTQATLGFNIL